MATISQLRKRLDHSQARNGSFFIKTASGDFVNFGRIQDATVNFETVEDSEDQDGRTVVLVYTLQLSFALKQTSNSELSMAPELAQPGDSEYPNGHTIYVSGTKQTSTSEVNAAASDSAIPSGLDDEGVGFEGLSLKPGIELQIGTDESLMTVESTGTLEVEELAALDTDTPLLTISYE